MGNPLVNRNLFILHLTVIVWGFTGILGNVISVSAIHLVWYRVLIAFISLVIYFGISGKNMVVNRTNLGEFLLTGGLVGLHWVLFFHAIKISTVSVTLVCMSSITLFTALLEPVFYKRRISKLDLVTGLFIIIGIYLIFKFESEYVWGIIAGLSCALVASLFSIINSKLVKKSGATIISLYEMLGAWLWVSLFMLISGGFNSEMKLHHTDMVYLLLLGTVCTSGAYVAGVSVMKELSAFRVALVTNMEPIYGIILAWLFFRKEEVMSGGFYIGALIVLAAVFLYPVIRTQMEKRKLRHVLPIA